MNTVPCAGHVDDHVAPGVRGPHLDEVDLGVADPQGQLAVEGGGRGHDLDVGEVEGPEHRPHELPAGPSGGAAMSAASRAGGSSRHLLGAGPGADDLGVAHELVAPAVVAVGVGVDDRADGPRPPARRRAWCRASRR